MLTHLLFSPGDLVFVEDPTYFIATKMLQEDCKMKTVPGKLLNLLLPSDSPLEIYIVQPTIRQTDRQADRQTVRDRHRYSTA